MKYLITLSLSLFLFACSLSEKPQNSYANTGAAVHAGSIPFDLNSARVVSSVVNPNERQAILILAERTSQIEKINLSNSPEPLPGTKWLMIHWRQKDDPVWVGARIPGKYLYADLVTFAQVGMNIERYDNTGKPLPLNENEKAEISKFALSIKPL